MDQPTLRNLTSPNFGKPPKLPNELLQNLGKYHIDSFNYFVTDGIRKALENMIPVEFMTPNDVCVLLKLEDITIYPPKIPAGSIGARTEKIYPMECRQRKITYNGRLEVVLKWSLNGIAQRSIRKTIGHIPIMLKSKLCNLNDSSPAELVKRGEHADEWGGYFIVKGRERFVRMLLNPRRNYPMVIKRSTWKNKDLHFSDVGIYIRCIAADHTAANNVLHYLTDGSAKLMVPYRKALYYMPVLLIIKCLIGHPDEFIYQHLISGFENDEYFKGCIMEMMRSLHENGIHTQNDAIKYMGQMFRVKVTLDIAPWTSDQEICQFVLRHCILIHLTDNYDKFRLLILMTQKLFATAQNHYLTENIDGMMFQELLLGGHLYLQILKEKLQIWLGMMKNYILKSFKPNSLLTEVEIETAMKKNDFVQISLESFFSTGNIVTPSGLGLQQDKGLTIMVENISRMRYMSHFHAVHKGSLFEQMKTTEPRQLLPDAWGFICPVHTPDGTPCGLLNHLARTCQLKGLLFRQLNMYKQRMIEKKSHQDNIASKKYLEQQLNVGIPIFDNISNVVNDDRINQIISVLVSLGMSPVTISTLPKSISSCSYVVILDGRVIGYILESMIRSIVHLLRCLKIEDQMVPRTLEIIFLERKEEVSTQFPGLFLFTGSARMMRPVVNVAVGQIEIIGTFEQVYLDVSLTSDQCIPGISMHHELSKSDFLSYAASLIPLPDYNQSPRNMYQCQMGKQSMGTACHNWQLQCETKLYRLQTPASPLFRPLYHDLLKMDDFAMGLNAVVAVISYTGYDMEDAMIINKSSLERGFAHGSIYKSETVELKAHCYFMRDPDNNILKKIVDADGLPFVGSRIKSGDYFYSYFDGQLQSYLLGKYKGKEEVIIDNVKLCGDFQTGKMIPSKACFVFRVPRNPTVGDKFASRAGQKGIFSRPWKMEDLPFTESGIVPDIVFNPHGFPSRMTIAMMIECMAGKAAALHGHVYDASPFTFSESRPAINYFGELLQQCGYNYYGNERMYSGVDGTEMKASIFFGIVHYQRLRHMVSDKWQVRSTGPIDIVTRQPIKGRKRGGGGRVGEMERDALLAHGVPYVILDRFVHCSDKSTALVCSKCETILGPTVTTNSADGLNKTEYAKCRVCDSTLIHEVGIPYILQYLIAEFASVNINVLFRK